MDKETIYGSGDEVFFLDNNQNIIRVTVQAYSPSQKKYAITLPDNRRDIVFKERVSHIVENLINIIEEN